MENGGNKIDKKQLNHLADLARLNLNADEETKFLKDLGDILNYFTELQKVYTENVPPMNGGTGLQNIFREDVGEPTFTDTDKIRAEFPESDKGYLKVPHVFGDK